jgi:1-acyl-sn-glycerol-3-phosphate acyltransferase
MPAAFTSHRPPPRVQPEPAPVARILTLAAVALHVLGGLLIAPFMGRPETMPPHGFALRLVSAWQRRLCRLLHLRVRVQGEPLDGPVLLAANHISWLDIIVLGGVCETRFLAKQDVRQWPLVGGMCARAGTLFIRRNEPGAAQHAADEMTWILRRGCRLALFPEGTTTDGAAVARFHSRLFQAAVRAHAPVQPVALQYFEDGLRSARAPFLGEQSLLNHLWHLAARGLDVELRFLPPLTGLAERAPLAAASHAAIAACIEADRQAATA